VLVVIFTSGLHVVNHGAALVRFVDVAGIQPVVDRVFRFDEAIQAYEYLEAGRHFGKVVIQAA
jgi:NADPH:quinone reductase-like Zn-dependent oxidoreductase